MIGVFTKFIRSPYFYRYLTLFGCSLLHSILANSSDSAALYITAWLL